MLRQALLRMSRSARIRGAITKAPVTSDVVSRFVAGESTDDVVAVTKQLISAGLTVSIDHLGEDTTDRAHADQVVAAYLELLDRLRDAGLGPDAEVSVKASAVGLLLDDGEQVALDHAQQICSAARDAGTTVTIDMEDHTTTDATLTIVSQLRQDFPSTGAVLQAYLRRTEADCRDLATAGSRVRLCKGAYAEPESVAYVEEEEIDLSYVRCLKVLMSGSGYPMIASHDPRLVEIGRKLAHDRGRGPDSYEFQMLYGIRPNEQRRLVKLGHQMRVYVPYGEDWYGYLIRRLAERPANLTFFARSLVSKS